MDITTRDINSLTNEEIRNFLNIEFHIIRDIEDDDIFRNGNAIYLTVYLRDNYPDITDTLILTIDGITLEEFDTKKESYRWLQYLETKGIIRGYSLEQQIRDNIDFLTLTGR